MGGKMDYDDLKTAYEQTLEELKDYQTRFKPNCEDQTGAPNCNGCGFAGYDKDGHFECYEPKFHTKEKAPCPGDCDVCSRTNAQRQFSIECKSYTGSLE